MATKRIPGAVVGRPRVPLDVDEDRYKLAFYLAHARVVNMRTTRANRRRGANTSSIWLSLLFKGTLFTGARVQEVPGCPKGFVDKCPPGSVPAVVLDERNEPMDTVQIKGHTAAIRKKIAKILRNKNPAEILWLKTATKIFELCLIAAQNGNPVALIEAKLIAKQFCDQMVTDFVQDFPWHADRIVAETNQGGEMVANTLRAVDPNVSYRGVHARKGKFVRAEPISALYEQRRVRHAGTFPELEDQLCTYDGSGDSPDRLDAMVYALSSLMVEPARPQFVFA